MNKTVIIINGGGGAGKDTLCSVAAGHYKTRVVSAVDRIKEIARFGGWDGAKDARGRKLLSDIKLAFIAYDDLPFKWLLEARDEFEAGDERVMFIHCREIPEIKKLRAAIPGAVTLLVRRPGIARVFGNVSDDLVEDYDYDYVYVNDKPLKKLDADFLPLLKRMIGET